MKKALRHPLFTEEKEINIFLSLCNDMDEESYVEVAKAIFVEGLTNEETAEKTNYSLRQVERIKQKVIKVVLKRAIMRLGRWK